jgi:hypothetical protein
VAAAPFWSLILDATAVTRFPLEDPVISSGFSAQPVSQFENKEIDLAAAGKSTTFCQKLCRRIPDPVSACTHIFSSGVADFVMLHGVGKHLLSSWA